MSREGDRLPTRSDEVFKGVLAVVGGIYVYHVVAGQSRGSIEADQVHRDELWGGVE
jgi:hypothetical protein